MIIKSGLMAKSQDLFVFQDVCWRKMGRDMQLHDKLTVGEPHFSDVSSVRGSEFLLQADRSDHLSSAGQITHASWLSPTFFSTPESLIRSFRCGFYLSVTSWYSNTTCHDQYLTIGKLFRLQTLHKNILMILQCIWVKTMTKHSRLCTHEK